MKIAESHVSELQYFLLPLASPNRRMVVCILDVEDRWILLDYTLHLVELNGKQDVFVFKKSLDQSIISLKQLIWLTRTDNSSSAASLSHINGNPFDFRLSNIRTTEGTKYLPLRDVPALDRTDMISICAYCTSLQSADLSHYSYNNYNRSQNSLPHCDSRDLSYCSLCLSVSYCSRECQIADWNNHASACSIIAQSNGSRPSAIQSALSQSLKDQSLYQNSSNISCEMEFIGR